MRRAAGFTLVELLIAMVIAAILAAIAVPSYRSYVQRTQRTEARQALTQARAAQERFFLQYNRYAAEISTASPQGLGLPNPTVNGKEKEWAPSRRHAFLWRWLNSLKKENTLFNWNKTCV